MAFNTACGGGFPLNIGGGGDAAEIADLESAVTALQTAVGDETGGLVKDVDDLQTTVGDDTSGLVKDVDDLQTAVSGLNANVYSETPVIVGKWLGQDLYRKVTYISSLPNNTKTEYASGITDTITVRHIYGTTVSSSVHTIPHIAYKIDMLYLKNTNKIEITTQGYDFSSMGAYIVIEYTIDPVPETNSKKKKGE